MRDKSPRKNSPERREQSPREKRLHIERKGGVPERRVSETTNLERIN